MIRRPPGSTSTDTLFPYTPLCRSVAADVRALAAGALEGEQHVIGSERLATLELPVFAQVKAPQGRIDLGPLRGQRSEEHTSELQPLMRISSAFFRFKKKNQTTHDQHKYHTSTIVRHLTR